VKIVLTSFRDAKNWKGVSCSIARYPPRNSDMPDFPVDVRPIYDGQILTEWMKPDNYRLKYEYVLNQRADKLLDLLCRIEDETLVLCCWCTPDRQTQFLGKLFCHRILLGWWIEEHFKFAVVKYGDGADKSIWKR